MAIYNAYGKLVSSTASPINPADKRELYPNPNRDITSLNRNAQYDLLFAYYSNSAFDQVSTWARYRLRYNLYRYTRPIFNPITRVVDFYPEHIYPGALSLEAGTKSAIPFSHTTPVEIQVAAAQMWQWSNWQNGNAIMVQNGAMTGNVAIDVIDDVENGKIRYQVYFPSMVKHIDLDSYDNVRGIVFEYTTSDPRVDDGQPFVYGKEVQRDFVAYYKNGKPYKYPWNESEARELEYGFTPVVWAKHIDIGSDFGVPAIRSAIGKIDELNSVISHTADHIHKQIESPRIIWTNGEIKPLFKGGADLENFDSRSTQVMLKGPNGGGTDTLVGTLDPQTIVPIIEKLMEEIERDYPEITLYEKLRDQNIVTAPGAARLMGDVERKIARPAANYDKANEKLIQMGAAIGGWRANSGHWGNDLTPQQSKFLPFDLESYAKGQLDLTILPRELTPQTTREEADELAVRANAISALGDSLPLEEKFRILGKREDEIPALAAAVKAEQAEKADAAMKLAQATKPDPSQSDKVKSSATGNAE